MKLKPDLVVVSAITRSGYKRLNWGWSSAATLIDGYAALLRPLIEAGIRVVVLGNNPYRKCQRMPACCCTARTRQSAPSKYLDMSGVFCRQGSCPAVVGNVLVYRDNHLTNTYAQTLAPVLAQRLSL